MKKLSTLYFFLFSLGLVLLLVRCHKDKADLGNQITILVKEKDTNLPISNANVRLCPTTNPVSVNCQELGKTDDNGRLIVSLNTPLVPENSKFYISKDGFYNDSILVLGSAQKTFSSNLKKLVILSKPIHITIQVKEKQTNVPIPNASIIFCEFNYPYNGNCQELGKTNAKGEFDSIVNIFLVPGSSVYYVSKDGFYRGSIPVLDTIQKPFNLTLGKVANLEFNLKYNSDSIPKEFVFYRAYTKPPAHNFIGADLNQLIGFIYAPKTNGVFQADTTIQLKLEYSDYWQYFHCRMYDPSYIVTPFFDFDPSIPDKVLSIPPNTSDTSFVFDVFW